MKVSYKQLWKDCVIIAFVVKCAWIVLSWLYFQHYLMIPFRPPRDCCAIENLGNYVHIQVLWSDVKFLLFRHYHILPFGLVSSRQRSVAWRCAVILLPSGRAYLPLWQFTVSPPTTWRFRVRRPCNEFIEIHFFSAATSAASWYSLCWKNIYIIFLLFLTCFHTTGKNIEKLPKLPIVGQMHLNGVKNWHFI